MAKLHEMFQAAMGWTNSRLHQFGVGEALYGTQFDDYRQRRSTRSRSRC